MEEVLFRDSCDIQPPVAAYERKAHENIYAVLEPAQFVACPEDLWQPLNKGEEEHGEQNIKVKIIFSKFYFHIWGLIRVLLRARFPGAWTGHDSSRGVCAGVAATHGCHSRPQGHWNSGHVHDSLGVVHG